MKSKYFFVTLFLVFIISIAGCGKIKTPPSSGPGPNPPSFPLEIVDSSTPWKESEGPDKLLDQNMETRFSTDTRQPGNGYVVLKRADVASLSKVGIAWYGPSDEQNRIYEFEIYTSVDGVNFTKVYPAGDGRAFNTKNNQYEDYTFPAVEAQYLKIVCYGNNSTAKMADQTPKSIFMSINEVSAWDSGSGDPGGQDPGGQDPGGEEPVDPPVDPEDKTITVNSASALKTALANAKPGHTIILEDGEYTSSVSVKNVRATEEHPVVIKAENRGKAVIKGQFTIEQSSYIIVEGLRFEDSSETKIHSSNNCRFTRNHFKKNESGKTSLKWLLVYGENSHHNRIDHNLFENKTIKGPILIIGDGNQTSQYDRIDHNYFKNNSPRADNEKETIRLGDSGSQAGSGYTIIEYNLFEDCDGDPEVISVKNCDNTIRYNTFVSCLGVVCLRHGHRNQVYGNYFLGNNKTGLDEKGATIGTGGVRLYGEDHKVYNNYFADLTGSGFGGTLQIDGGDDDKFGNGRSGHQTVSSAEICFNTFVNNEYNIEIGKNYTKAPRDCKIANNIVVGSKQDLVSVWKTPVNFTYEGNIMFPTGANQVGVSLSENEIWETDPLLEEVQINGYTIYRLSENSPARGWAKGNYPYVSEDIDGEARGSSIDVGSDQYSAFLPTNNKPLTPADVGPDSAEESI